MATVDTIGPTIDWVRRYPLVLSPINIDSKICTVHGYDKGTHFVMLLLVVTSRDSGTGGIGLLLW